MKTPELRSKSKEYEFARVHQNGTLLFEGPMKIIELRDEPEYYIYFKDSEGEYKHVGTISKFGCALSFTLNH